LSKIILILPSENNYLKTLYHIPPKNITNQSLSLMVEVGDSVLSSLWFDAQNNRVEGVSIHQIEEAIDWEMALKSIDAFSENQHLNFFFNTKESLFVPQKYYDANLNAQLLRLMYGENTAAVTKESYVEKLAAWHIFRIDNAIASLLQKTFVGMPLQHHASTVQLFNPIETNMLRCIFYQDSFKVLLFKGEALQMVQQFQFNTPEDVVYHLLNCCEQYEMKPTELKLVLSGLIVSDSNLFKQIYSYFLDVVFDVPETPITLTEEMTVFPPHFFSHLISLATCEL